MGPCHLTYKDNWKKKKTTKKLKNKTKKNTPKVKSLTGKNVVY